MPIQQRYVTDTRSTPLNPRAISPEKNAERPLSITGHIVYQKAVVDPPRSRTRLSYSATRLAPPSLGVLLPPAAPQRFSQARCTQ
eukprot:scaffold42457_cov68-Phaeocystis_antarctica.AAC.1